MNKGRLEAFSDGVIAIIITIMVLEMKVPQGQTLQALVPLVPVFLSYVLSFIYVGIYWNNHHHMLHATTRVTGAMLWPIFICSSGSRSFPLPPDGPVRTIPRPRLLHSTESSCSWPALPIGFCNKPSSPLRAPPLCSSRP